MYYFFAENIGTSLSKQGWSSCHLTSYEEWTSFLCCCELLRSLLSLDQLPTFYSSSFQCCEASPKVHFMWHFLLVPLPLGILPLSPQPLWCFILISWPSRRSWSAPRSLLRGSRLPSPTAAAFPVAPLAFYFQHRHFLFLCLTSPSLASFLFWLSVFLKNKTSCEVSHGRCGGDTRTHFALCVGTHSDPPVTQRCGKEWCYHKESDFIFLCSGADIF